MPQPLLALDMIKMGRWVADARVPHHDYHDSVGSETPPRVYKTMQAQLRHVYDHHGGRSSMVKGTLVAYSSAQKQRRDVDVFSTEQSTIYQLDNPQDGFRAAIAHRENRDWMKRALREHGKIYVIVGYQTVKDARVENVRIKNKERWNGIQAPTSAAIAGTVGVPVLGDALDPGVAWGKHRADNSQTCFVAPGEQVVAVQYRRVRFRFFSSRDLDEVTLEGDARWRYFSDLRGQETGTDDVIAPELAFTDSSGDERVETTFDSSDESND